MANDIKPTTIYINGVPISGVKSIDLTPAHPTVEKGLKFSDDGKPYYYWDFNYKPFKECVAVTQPAQKPEPKKVYLTTTNPYMSKDWKDTIRKKLQEELNVPVYVDTDVASMYPKLEQLVKEELAVHSPSKHLYEVGMQAAKGFNAAVFKVHKDAMDAARYSFEKYCDYAMEKSWEDYCYMLPPRHGKSVALDTIKLGERALEYCKQDVEETIRLYEAFKEKGNVMTLNEKLKEITKVLELVAAHVNARVYTKYHETKYALEFVFVEKGTGYTYTVEQKVDDLMNELVHGDSSGMYKLTMEAEACFRAWKKKLNPTYKYTGPISAYSLPQIKDVKFEDPATIVFWADGTKTVVRAQDEAYDPEKGLAMAISRKAMGNKRDYYHVFLKWLKKAIKCKK